MILPEYVKTMAAYNAELNRRVYGAALRLPDATRKADRGLFWHSIHGTLSHLCWADRIWLSRFGATEAPGVPIEASSAMVEDFLELWSQRQELDAQIIEWGDRIAPADLEGVNCAGSAGRPDGRSPGRRRSACCRSSITRPIIADRCTRP